MNGKLILDPTRVKLMKKMLNENSSVVQNEKALLQLNQQQNRISDVLNLLETHRKTRDSTYQALNGKCESVIGFLDKKVKMLEQQGKYSPRPTLSLTHLIFSLLHRTFLEVENNRMRING
jgi:hypothetical protein